MAKRPTVWIGRQEKECGRWIASANEAGWDAKPLPLLRIEGISLSDQEKELLHNLGPEDCLFLTSPTGIRFLFKMFQQVGSLPDCQYAVIGPGSAERLANGSGTVAGKEARYVAPARRGSSLAQTFLQNPVAGRLVFYGAQHPRPELRLGLEAADYSLLQIPAYRSDILPGPEPTPGQPVLVFSPNGAESLASRVERRSVHPVIALGPVTELAARALYFPVLGRLQHPTASSLTEFLSHV